MSELKARRAYFSEDEYDKGAHKICAKVSDCGYDRRNDWWSYAFEDEVYLKSDADKVIADLIEKNKRLAHKDLIMASETIKEVLEEINHQKYKRCLAMAKLCKTKRDEIIDQTPTLILSHVTEYLTRWENRWLELAEKFKEAK